MDCHKGVSRTTKYRAKKRRMHANHSSSDESRPMAIDDVDNTTDLDSWYDEYADDDPYTDDPVPVFLSDSGSDSDQDQHDQSITDEEAAQPNLSTEATHSDDKPLYKNASVSLLSTVVLIMQFVLRHGLSNKALEDLLQLLIILLPSPSNCPGSIYLFRRLLLAKPRPETTVHYFCSSCTINVEGSDRKCPNCAIDIDKQFKKSSFIQISVTDQLQSILEGKGVYHLVQQARQHSFKGNIFDIFAGLRHRELQSQGVFQGHYVTLTLNTDGIPVFRSSGYAFWPVYLIINELPFRMRFSKDNRILAGLWYGSMKPDMTLFLKPIMDNMAVLINQGFTLSIADSSITCKAFLLCFTCDLPAKAIVLNSVQFNGYWGCSKCLQKGNRVACGGGPGSVQTYPFDESDPCGPTRTHASSCEFGKIALSTGSSCNGIKGPSWLATVPHFDTTRSTSVDYMHCVLLGVCRQLLKLWLEPVHHKDLWYIGTTRKLQTMDKCLLGIKPPSEIKRTPRSIQTTRKYWKAHELRSWLLHYSPVVLKDILHEEYFKHHLLLLEGVYLLLCDSISTETLQKSTKFLKKYCYLFSTFYGERHMSANVHSLLHLPSVVEDLGPLWAHSCFGFESANGDLLQLFHGSQSVEKQVIKRIGDNIVVSAMAAKFLKNGTREMKLYLKMNKRRIYTNDDLTVVNETVALLGKAHYGSLSEAETQLMEKIVPSANMTSLQFYSHILLQEKNRVITAESMVKPSKRINCCVKFNRNSEATGPYGLLRKIVMVPVRQEVFVIITPISAANESIDGSPPGFEHHYTKCHQPTRGEIVIIPVTEIIDKCIYINTLSAEFVFVSHFPNSVEIE